VARKKKPLLLLSRRLLPLLLRWKLLPLLLLTLLLLLLPLTLLLLLLTLLLLPRPLLPSNFWLRNEKPALGPVFLCLQKTIEPRHRLDEARQGLGVGKPHVAGCEM